MLSVRAYFEPPCARQGETSNPSSKPMLSVDRGGSGANYVCMAFVGRLGSAVSLARTSRGNLGLTCMFDTPNDEASVLCSFRAMGMKGARVCCQTAIESVELRVRERRSVRASWYSDAGAQRHSDKREVEATEQRTALDVLAEGKLTMMARMREC